VNGPPGAVTKSLWPPRESLGVRHTGATKVTAMDAVAVILGVVMFLILLVMIEGIERV